MKYQTQIGAINTNNDILFFNAINVLVYDLTWLNMTYLRILSFKAGQTIEGAKNIYL